MSNEEQEIRQLASTWMTASKAGDVETVLSLMADDVVFLMAGRPPMRKAVANHPLRLMPLLAVQVDPTCP